jgi:cytochrome P450
VTPLLTARRNHSRLPPGPATPALLQTYLWLTRPSFMDRCARRYGDLFTLRLVQLGPHVYLADPELVRQVFTGDPHVYHAGEAYRTLMEPVGGPRSLFVLDEDEHLRMRRWLLPPFHGERMKSWEPVIREITEREMARWPVGIPFELRPSAEAITLEVIMRIVFGIREPDRATELRRLLPRLFHVSLSQAPSFVVPALRRDLGPHSPWGRFLRLRGRIDALLHDEIRRRREELGPAGPDELGDRDDMLSMLIAARDEDGRQLTDADLRDVLITMLLAGHETTSSSLSWVFERLLRHPPVLARLLDDLGQGGEEYLGAVIKETLRVRPVGAHVARRLADEVELRDYRVPAGTTVAVSIYLMHRSPSLFPDPMEFRPERFLEAGSGSYSWIPFGGGVRRCLGAGLATLEMEVVLRTVLEAVRLRPARAESERIDVLGVTLVPARGAEVVMDGPRPGAPTRSRANAPAP